MSDDVRFVGVRKYPENAYLLEHGRPVAGRVRSADLAYDCIRHRDFIERVVNGSWSAVRETLYWRYLVLTRCPPDAADERCRRFVELYESVQRNGLDRERGDAIAVTDGGIRVNGAHRAAIAEALAIPHVEVATYSWRETLAGWRIRHIIEEARVKREGQAAFAGRSVLLQDEEDPQARVAYVDADVPRRLLTLVGRRIRPVLVVERSSGALQRFEVDEATLP